MERYAHTLIDRVFPEYEGVFCKPFLPSAPGIDPPDRHCAGRDRPRTRMTGSPEVLYCRGEGLGGAQRHPRCRAGHRSGNSGSVSRLVPEAVTKEPYRSLEIPPEPETIQSFRKEVRAVFREGLGAGE